ncbi:MAG: right-handed parallel beta-helix repeat-containing protein [Acidobacteriota bacterium]
MRRSKVFLACLALTVVSTTAKAADLYVSTSGNDTNAGTLAAPFKTITKAGTVAQPGDTVNVRGGVYFERVSIMSKGTAAKRIVFRSYPGENAIIDGTGLASNKATMAITETEYVDISGFEVRNSPFIGISLWYAKQTRVLDNVVHGAVRNGIYVGADATGIVSDITVSGNTVYDTVLENQYHNMGGGGWAGAVVVALCDRATITNNRIRNNDGEGLISLRSNNALIQDNEISDSFSVELYIDNARYVTANRNLIYSTGNTRYFRDGYPAAGIAVANETSANMNPSSDNVFSNNIVVGSRWGFYYGSFESGGGLRNTKVLNNTFYGSKQAILQIEDDAGHTNSTIQNNIFYSTGSPTPQYAGTNGVTYRNNLWYGTTAGAAAGTGDVFANPALANAGGLTAADYRIKLGSAAIAKALDTSSVVSTDYFGTLRVSPFDIGAHQFSTGLVADTLAPAVPANLRASGGTSTSLNLAWDAASDNVAVTGYTVYRNGAVVATVSAPGWTDPAVNEALLYTYQVQAFDAAGNRSALSATLSMAWSASNGGTDTTAPTAPANLRGNASSATATDLWWDNASDNVGVVAYRVFRDGVLVGTVTTAAFSDAGLLASTSYTYHVTAIDAAGNVSVRSNKYVIKTKAAPRGRSSHS